MTVKIDTDAEIESIRMKEDTTALTPDAGYTHLQVRADGLYIINDSDEIIGPFITGTSAGGGSVFTNDSQSLTGSGTFTGVVNYRYFFDISGLGGDKHFTLPSGTIGDEIEVNILVGDADYELILEGAGGVTVNGGSAATEWSRLFIDDEVVKLVLSTGGNWQVVQDGRIPCIATFERISSDGNTTHLAATDITADWNSLYNDIGGMGDLTNERANIRRAGIYEAVGSYAPAAAVADQEYMSVLIYKNAAIVASGGLRQSVSGVSGITMAGVMVKAHSCVEGDYLLYAFTTEAADVGLKRTDTASTNLRTSYFQVKEVL